MDTRFIHIGFSNSVSLARIIAIVSPESAPIKRIVAEAKGKNMIIDATHGRRTRAVLIMDTGHVILSAIMPETVASRVYIASDGEIKEDAKAGVNSGTGGESSEMLKEEMKNEIRDEIKNEKRQRKAGV